MENVDQITQSKNIEHVRQRNQSDCMLACLCMASGKTYDELWTPEMVQKVIDEHGTGGETEKEVFAIAGFKYNENCWRIYPGGLTLHVVKQLIKGRRAIITVPSLNYQGGYHAIYWTGHILLDPQWDDKNVYKFLEPVVVESVRIFNEV